MYDACLLCRLQSVSVGATSCFVPTLKSVTTGSFECYAAMLCLSKRYHCCEVDSSFSFFRNGPNPGADFEKPGTELDLREGGVRYRVKLRKYVVEYRPSRFKWKLWMGTYSSLQDGRRAYDCAVFYAGQGKGNYYFRNSPELFKNLGPLERPFHMVSKDIRDKPFNVEVKKRAKEVIKRSVRIGDMEAPSIMASRSARKVVEVEGFEKEPEPKEVDPTFKDLEPLFHLHSPLYSRAELMIGSNGLLRSEMIDSSFFVAGLNYMDMPKFVQDCKSDESCHSDLPLWIYEFMNPPSWIDES